MSALFNQTNISPGTAFVSGGSGSNFPSGLTISQGGSNIHYLQIDPSVWGEAMLAIENSSNTSSAIPQDLCARSLLAFSWDGSNSATQKSGSYSSSNIYYQGNAGSGSGTSFLQVNDSALGTSNAAFVLTGISTINGVPPGSSGSSAINLLVRPDAPGARIALNPGDNYFSSNVFPSTVTLAPSTIYSLACKSSLNWVGTPDSNDWAQLYVQLGGGQPVDETRVSPVIPYLAYTYGGNVYESVYLNTLFRTTEATTFDMSLALSVVGSASYQLNVAWVSLQNIGAYT